MNCIAESNRGNLNMVILSIFTFFNRCPSILPKEYRTKKTGRTSSDEDGSLRN